MGSVKINLHYHSFKWTLFAAKAMDGPKDDREVFARNLHAALSEAASTPPVTPPARMPSFASDPGQLEVLDTKSILESLSVSAMKKRIARLMTPKSDGSYKVPKELVDAWKAGEHDRIVQDFVDAGCDKEPNIKVSINIPPCVKPKNGYNTFV